MNYLKLNSIKANRLFSLFSVSFVFCVFLTAQEYIPPKLEFTCELKVIIDSAMTLGRTPHGERVIIPISGGTFEGPKLKGIVLKGGADYQIVAKHNGRTELEAIYTIKTDDNVLIHVRNVGILYVPEEIRNSNPFDISKMYFKATPRFEVSENSKYNWMNNSIFICNAVACKGYVSIQVWRVF